jgi:C4-dicarboxylate transporter DctQ subunit
LKKWIRTVELLLWVHDAVIDGMTHAMAWMTGIATLGVGYEVVMRYFFARPTSWSVDLVEYTMLYATFLAAAWLARQEQHINLTYLLDAVSPRTRHIAEGINSLISAFLCAIIIWYSAIDTLDAIVEGIAVNRTLMVPKSLVLGVIPVGCFVLLVQFIRNAFGHFKAG